MGSFDYLFSFYGLLLGIAVANVAIGFADMWRDSEKVAVGTCPPLVASSVLLGGMNVWLQMWWSRPFVTVDGTQMLTAAAVSLPYVFVSRAIFPGQEVARGPLPAPPQAHPPAAGGPHHRIGRLAHPDRWRALLVSGRGLGHRAHCGAFGSDPVRQPHRAADRPCRAQPAPAGWAAWGAASVT